VSGRRKWCIIVRGMPIVRSIVMTAASRCRTATLAVVFTAVAATCTAQGVAGSFEQLSAAAGPGDVVYVTNASGQQIRARVFSISDASLELIVSRATGGTTASSDRLSLTERDVVRIDRQNRDSVWNGVVLGAAGAGIAGFAVWYYTSSGCDCSFPEAMARVIPAYALAGAGIGALVDSWIHSRSTIYESPRRGASAPVMSPGLLRLSIRF